MHWSPRGLTASSFSLSLDFDREKGWHEGSPTPVFCSPFLAACGYTLGPPQTDRAWRLPVWGQDPPLPRYVKKILKKCNGLWVKQLGGLRKTGFDSWLCNGSSSWPWATYLICLCFGIMPCAPRTAVLRLYVMTFDSGCAEGVQGGKQVGAQDDVWGQGYASRRWTAVSVFFHIIFYTSCNHFMRSLLVLHVYLRKICPWHYTR